MHFRDSSGRMVSILNSDSHVDSSSQRPLPQRPLSYQSSYSFPSPSSRSHSASPHMPALSRSDSYDSQTSTDVISPMTPSADNPFARTSLYTINQDYDNYSQTKRPGYADSSRGTSYTEDDAMSTSTSSMTERAVKRYPCRYRESHGCEKTFTTSGHASRHSKIHTAEKAVQCTYPSCQKKFTRADNMKQHLETHFKDKSRSTPGVPRVHKSAMPESRRNASSSRNRSSGHDAISHWEREQLPLPSPSPSPYAWNLNDLSLPLLNRPMPGRTPSSGLDALAMAVACQEIER